jgi:hypothetical protein
MLLGMFNREHDGGTERKIPGEVFLML